MHAHLMFTIIFLPHQNAIIIVHVCVRVCVFVWLLVWCKHNNENKSLIGIAAHSFYRWMFGQTTRIWQNKAEKWSNKQHYYGKQLAQTSIFSCSGSTSSFLSLRWVTHMIGFLLATSQLHSKRFRLFEFKQFSIRKLLSNTNRTLSNENIKLTNLKIAEIFLIGIFPWSRAVVCTEIFGPEQ